MFFASFLKMLQDFTNNHIHIYQNCTEKNKTDMCLYLAELPNVMNQFQTSLDQMNYNHIYVRKIRKNVVEAKTLLETGRSFEYEQNYVEEMLKKGKMANLKNIHRTLI